MTDRTAAEDVVVARLRGADSGAIATAWRSTDPRTAAIHDDLQVRLRAAHKVPLAFADEYPDVFKALNELQKAAREAADAITALLAERDGLRTAMIDVGRQVGGGLADTVSSDFLLHVPGEVRARLAIVDSAAESFHRRMIAAETRVTELEAALEPFTFPGLSWKHGDRVSCSMLIEDIERARASQEKQTT